MGIQSLSVNGRLDRETEGSVSSSSGSSRREAARSSRSKAAGAGSTADSPSTMMALQCKSIQVRDTERKGKKVIRARLGAVKSNDQKVLILGGHFREVLIDSL